jgi:ribosome-associated protein
LASTKTVSRSRTSATAGKSGRSKTSAAKATEGGAGASVKRVKATSAGASPRAPAAKKASTSARRVGAVANDSSAPTSKASKPASAARKSAPAAKSLGSARKSAPVAKRPASTRKSAAAAKGTSATRKADALAATLKTASTVKAPARTKQKTDPVAKLLAQVVEGLERIKARDVREIDVRGRASFADLLVIASGTSTTHVRAIADEVIKQAKRVGTMPLGVEGVREAEWVLVDLGDIVVHVMLPRVRDFYALERLWTVGAEDPYAAFPA